MMNNRMHFVDNIRGLISDKRIFHKPKRKRDMTLHIRHYCHQNTVKT